MTIKYFKPGIKQKISITIYPHFPEKSFAKEEANRKTRNTLRVLEGSRLAKFSDPLAVSCFAVKMHM